MTTEAKFPTHESRHYPQEELRRLEQGAENIQNAYKALLDEKGYLRRIQTGNPDSSGVIKINDFAEYGPGMMEKGRLTIEKDGFWFTYSGFNKQLSKITVRHGNYPTRIGDTSEFNEKTLHLFVHHIQDNFPHPVIYYDEDVVKYQATEWLPVSIKTDRITTAEDAYALVAGYELLEELRTIMPSAGK